MQPVVLWLFSEANLVSPKLKGRALLPRNTGQRAFPHTALRTFSQKMKDKVEGLESCLAIYQWCQLLAYCHSCAALGCQQVRVSREKNGRFARHGIKLLGFFSDKHSDFFPLIFEHSKFDSMSSEISLLRLFLNFFYVIYCSVLNHSNKRAFQSLVRDLKPRT